MDKNLQKQADRGWALMSQKLDREMPKSRRRAGFWWPWPVAFCGLLLAGAGLVFLMNNDRRPENAGSDPATWMAAVNLPESKSENTQIIEDQPAASKRAEPQTGRDLTETNRPVEKKGEIVKPAETGFFQKNQAKSGGENQLSIPQNFTKKGSGAALAPTENLPENVAAQPGIMAENLRQIPGKNAVPEIQKTLDGQPVLVEKKEADLLLSKKIQPFATLPGRLFQPVDFLKKTPAAIEKQIKPIAEKSPRNWRIGVALGAQSVDLQQLGGHSLGLAATRHLAKKTSLTTGIQWARTVLSPAPANKFELCILVPQPDYVNETYDYALEYTDPSNSVVTPKTNGTIDYFSVQLAVSANVLHRLEIPLLLTQKLAPRWHIGGGISGSWQLMARSVIGASSLSREKAGDYNSGSGVTNITPNGESLRSSQQVNKILTRNLPRFDVAAVGFIGFDVTRKWRLAAQFQQGLLNQTALPGYQKRLHSARFSVVRWF